MTIGVDFDGVIHQYSKGWADGSIYGPPITGSLDGLRLLMKEHAAFIFTTRNAESVAGWLRVRGIAAHTEREMAADGKPVREFWNHRDIVLVTNRKLGATAYIDDRAIRFQHWPQALADIASGAQPGVLLPSQRALWAAACRAVAQKIRTTELPQGDGFIDMFDNGTQWAADLADQLANTPPEQP